MKTASAVFIREACDRSVSYPFHPKKTDEFKVVFQCGGLSKYAYFSLELNIKGNHKCERIACYQSLK